MEFSFLVFSNDGGDVTQKRADVSTIQCAKTEKTQYCQWSAQGNCHI
jgi:hypothetical protein